MSPPLSLCFDQHQTEKYICVCRFLFFSSPSLCSSGFLISLWWVSWPVGCSLTDGRIREGLEMATLIWGANPSPTPAIGAAIPAGRSGTGWDDHEKGPDLSRTSKDHSAGRVICWRNNGLAMQMSQSWWELDRKQPLHGHLTWHLFICADVVVKRLCLISPVTTCGANNTAARWEIKAQGVSRYFQRFFRYSLKWNCSNLIYYLAH